MNRYEQQAFARLDQIAAAQQRIADALERIADAVAPKPTQEQS